MRSARKWEKTPALESSCRNDLEPMKTPLALLMASMLLAAGLASAQDGLRNSMAGDAAAAAQRQQMESQLYTFKAGDFRLLAVPSVEMDYNDNVNLAKTDVQSDFILKPLLQLTGSYPISQQNLLSFSAGVGYNQYLEHPQYSALQLSSDSELLFDMRIKDFLFDFHERASFIEDPGAEASLSGTAQYATFMNTAGLTTTWDLEDLTLTLGCDHANILASTTQFDYLDHTSELPVARAGFKLRPDLTLGVEGSASFTAYEHAVLNNNESYSAGLYADWKPGPYTDILPRVGYTIYQFQQTSQSAQIFEVNSAGNLIIAPVGESIQTANLNTWYADLTVSHKPTDAVAYAFSAGREIRLGIQSDVIEDYYVRPNITWTIIKNLGFNTSFFYEHGNQGAGNIMGNLTETYNWYGGALTLSYPLIKRVLLGLNYRLTLRSSTQASMEYAQNLVGLTVTYQLQ
jgi:hypothetical protein